METIQTLYSELFSIQFIHNEFGPERHNVISDNIRIEPDRDTRSIIANLGIGYRFTDNLFTCFVRAKRLAPPANQPRAPLIENKEETRLRFLIYVNAGFISKTDVAHAGAKSVYHFSNRTNNIDPGPPVRKLLHKNLPFVNDTDLEPVNNVNASEKCFGVIDIYNTGTQNDYRLFNASGQLLDPGYFISLKTRA